MRTIKFRAWDKHSATMSYSDSYPTMSMFWDYADALKKEIMQYTGLKDSKGVQIYEGDIIEIELSPERAFTDGNPEVFRIEVYYGTYDAGFHGKRIPSGSLYSIGFSGSAVVRREVIGNIYENPELTNNKS